MASRTARKGTSRYKTRISLMKIIRPIFFESKSVKKEFAFINLQIQKRCTL